MKNLVKTSLALLFVTFSFHVAHAVESDGSPSADQVEGQIEANSQDQMGALLMKAKATSEAIAALDQNVGLNSDDSEQSQYLVRAMGEKTDLAEADYRQMIALTFRLNKTSVNDQISPLTKQIRDLAAKIETLQKEAQDLVKTYSPSLE